MPTPDPRFQKAQEEYARLKSQLNAGQLTSAQFESALDQLMLSDDQGRYWMIGAETGKWYVHNGQTWVESTPGGPAAALPPSPPPSGSVTSAPAAVPTGRPPVVEPSAPPSGPRVVAPAEPAPPGTNTRVLAPIAFIGVFLCVLLAGVLALFVFRDVLSGLLGGTPLAQATRTATATLIAAATAPATPVPATSAPATSVPATSIPATSAPATSAPATTAPTAIPPTRPPVPTLPSIPLPPTPTLEPTATVAPSPTTVPPSPLPPRPTATTAPSYPPGVYVTKIRTDPGDAKRNQDVRFLVTFVNTSGEPRSYSFLVWTYYENGKGLGETPVKGITVPVGTNEIQTEPWILKGAGSCLPVLARAGWRNPDRSTGFFPSTDGNVLQYSFQVCP